MKELITILVLILVSPASFIMGLKVKELECNIKIKRFEKTNSEKIIQLENRVAENKIAIVKTLRDKEIKNIDIGDEYDEGYINGIEKAITTLDNFR